ncbi:sugar phosphate isomerase/epimerase [Rubripirellula sp.]|jgi:sugar phosphate isomerase/epimerase|nr:sugar phosphate isomerase/epimerase [Rhodopirellula sp.]MDA9840457.1 sugar phosphate isomerase/epimerase [Rubripirellula sp.]
MKNQSSFWVMLLVAIICCFGPFTSRESAAQQDDAELPIHEKVYGIDNLVAWCIVPFDANRRGPAERAEMVKDLGIRRVAYDWREEHVPTFEREIIEYQKNGIDFFAFWSWHDALEPLIAKYKIQPQIWVTLTSPNADDEKDKINQAADSLMPLVEKTKRLGLKLGLYNHGGWGGRPSSLISVCETLRQRSQSDHVGIVYNFHHAHEDTEEFFIQLTNLNPYLLCLNLNGMVDLEEMRTENKKIIPVGSGKHELAMMRALLASGYRGPVGILDHRNELDARDSLQQNLDGLNDLIKHW